MKKVLVTLLAVALLFVGVRPVSAMTQEDLLNRLEQVYNINGVEFKVPDAMKVQVKRYADQYGISDQDADYISKQFEVVKKAIQDNEIKSTKELGKIKTQLINVFNDVVKNTKIDGTYKDGQFIVYQPGTKKAFIAFDVTGLVKQTGTETNAIAILAGVSLAVIVAGTFVIVRKSRFN